MTHSELKFKFKSHTGNDAVWRILHVEQRYEQPKLKSEYGRWLELQLSQHENKTIVDLRLEYNSNTGYHAVKDPAIDNNLFMTEAYFIQDYIEQLEEKVLDI